MFNCYYDLHIEPKTAAQLLICIIVKRDYVTSRTVWINQLLREKYKQSPSPYSLSFPLIRLNSSKHPKGQRVYFLIRDAAPLNIGYSLPISGSIVNISHTEIQTSIGPWCQKDCLICQKGSEQLSTIVIEVISSYCFNVRHAVCEL